MKIPERLEPLVQEGLIEEVVRPLTSGKEASLYIVWTGEDYCAAKVYKDAQHRSFRHRAGYAEGRRVRNSRQRRAMERGTKYGKEQAESAWQNAEVDALYRLSFAGVRVPKPRIYTDGVLLMDLVLDPEGQPAPRLWDVDLGEEEAVEVHRFLVHQAVLMLCVGLVHGDLSEYNVLMAWDGPTVIDLPQATDAAHNPNARRLFVRDVENLTGFLARFAPQLAETRYGQEIWDHYERATLFPDTPLTGRWRGSQRRVDTRAVLAEIETAARDARQRLQSDGQVPRDRRLRQDAPPSQETRPRLETKPRQETRPRQEARPRQDARPRQETRPRQEASPEASDLDLDDLDRLLVEEP